MSLIRLRWSGIMTTSSLLDDAGSSGNESTRGLEVAREKIVSDVTLLSLFCALFARSSVCLSLLGVSRVDLTGFWGNEKDGFTL